MPDTQVDTRDKRWGEFARLFPVIFIVCNIVGLYLIYTIFHLIPMVQEESTANRGFVELVVFNISTFLLVTAYLRCILVHPGGIPDKDEDPTWEYAGEDGKGPGNPRAPLQETKKSSGQRRHCKWCAKYKPDRCHHCRVCRMCILKMDHHCPWIYNCVGFRNHKYFFLLLLYAAFTCMFIAITMLESVKEVIGNTEGFASMFLLLFGETLAAFMGILVTVFFGFHVWLMMKAMTTIEFCEKSKTAGYDTSMYDRGPLGNIRSVLGDNPFLWLLPISPPSGRGVYFLGEDALLGRPLETDRGLRKKCHRRSREYGSTRHHSEGERKGRRKHGSSIGSSSVSDDKSQAEFRGFAASIHGGTPHAGEA